MSGGPARLAPDLPPGMTPDEFIRLRNELALLAPPTLDVEPTNLCNLRCCFCPREALKRPRGRMTLSTYATVLTRVPAEGSLYLCGLGEPLLHPEIVEMVELAARSSQRRVTLVTNATLLEQPLAERLRDAGLGVLQISFNGATPEVFERVMVGADFGATVARIERALAVLAGRVRVEVLFTETRLNAHQTEQVTAFWTSRGVDQIVVTPCHSRAGYLDDPALAEMRSPPPFPACGIFATVTFVAWTGEVLACCQDLPGATRLGSLLEDDFDEIVRRKRAVIREGRWYPICARCETPLRTSTLGLGAPSRPSHRGRPEAAGRKEARR